MQKETRADSLRAVSPPITSPYKMWTISASKYLDPILTIEGQKEPYNMPRQKLPAIWAQTGVLDIIKTDTIIKKKSMTGDRIIPLIIEDEFYVDIDNRKSLNLAEIAIRETDCIKP